MIEITNANKKFNKQDVLKNINLRVNDNEIVAIIGPSGAGKSTLLRSINLLETPDSGHIVIDDLSVDFANFSKEQMFKLRQKSAMVFQNFNLFVNKNILDNVSEALIVVKKIPKNQAKDIAIEQLKSVGLAQKAHSYPYELSGGQQQRVAIARALALNPSIMLFDEPTSALDVELIAEVLEVIKSIKGKTMLIVTHELKFAKAIADRIIFMSEGEIIEQERAKLFFESPKNERVRSFLAKVSQLG
ncbi:amino acid ABC transporter ATP-binding protein [Helicobacter japonicus]|uniref:Amino acid ABC transporter ATP-binding protein n=1 Tax=Helicobacter japonicus TaxID=425400 RepID=A0A4U8TSJ8_9HELI|nr:amino acid ABC transporter ATP-binding protein [Helicobacter japonicus]TLE02815.1 amino acid ABC transporter ATP-binding protein [Helicobacter japonicus]